MCGIFCGINCVIETNEQLQRSLKRRGPDFNCSVNIKLDSASLQFVSSVLWQQGPTLCSQPFQLKNLIMLLNGDIFNVRDKLDRVSDTEWLGKSLSDCTDVKGVCEVIRSLEGPFSVVFFNKYTHDLYICRDSMGRNSLLIEKDNEELRFMSTSCNYKESRKAVMELPPLGLFQINVFAPTVWKLYPWKQICATVSEGIKRLTNVFGLTLSVEENMEPNWLKKDSESKELFNLYEMCRMHTSSSNIFEVLLRNSYVLSALKEFSNLIERSVKDRVRRTPQKCANCLDSHTDCNHAKIAILFSGGIDCSILAAISSKYVDKSDPIDLINVAFQKVDDFGGTSWDVPDRISAKSSLLELQKLYPVRLWNYVEVNISREELHTNLHNHIKHLIFPLNTVLDESLGSAFWFASRGKGICLGKEYTSPARVVMVGSGADELFGGYMRHRNAFRYYEGNETEKIANIRKELEKDWNRISARNLGRDDRVVADNGKTLRAPFIEENLVQYVRSFPPSQLCCFLLKEGIGDKLFLRLYGYHIGLQKVANLQKRAIQFGSKVANKKQKAADRSLYL